MVLAAVINGARDDYRQFRDSEITMEHESRRDGWLWRNTRLKGAEHIAAFHRALKRDVASSVKWSEIPRKVRFKAFANSSPALSCASTRRAVLLHHHFLCSSKLVEH
jgi:hypothetical protein